MSFLLSFGIAFILMFLLPAVLGTRVFNGTPLGDVFLDVAYWPFLVSDTLFAIENLDLAFAVSVGSTIRWFVVCVLRLMKPIIRVGSHSGNMSDILKYLAEGTKKREAGNRRLKPGLNDSFVGLWWRFVE